MNIPAFLRSCHNSTVYNAKKQLHAVRSGATQDKLQLIKYSPGPSRQPHRLAKTSEPLAEVDVIHTNCASINTFVELATKAEKGGQARSQIAEGGEADVFAIKPAIFSHRGLQCQGSERLAAGKLYAAKAFKTEFRTMDEATEQVACEMVNTFLAARTGTPVMQLQAIVAFKHTDSIQAYAPYLLLYEYAEDGSLFDALKYGSIESLNDRLQYSLQMLEICLTLSAGSTVELLHGQKVTEWLLHRDIKPNNFLLRDGQLQLIDFSLATMCPEGYDQLTSEEFQNIFNTSLGTSGFVVRNTTIQRDPSATLVSMLMTVLGVTSTDVTITPWFSYDELTAGRLELFSWLHDKGLLRLVMAHMQTDYSVPGGTLSENADTVCEVVELLAVAHAEGLNMDSCNKLLQQLRSVAAQIHTAGNAATGSGKGDPMAMRHEAVLLDAAVHHVLASQYGSPEDMLKTPFFRPAVQRLTCMSVTDAANLDKMLARSLYKMQTEGHLPPPRSAADLLAGVPQLPPRQQLVLLDLPVKQPNTGKGHGCEWGGRHKREASHSSDKQPAPKASRWAVDAGKMDPHMQLAQRDTAVATQAAGDLTHVVKLGLKAGRRGPLIGFGDAQRLWNHLQPVLASVLKQPDITQCTSWTDAPANKYIQHIAVYHNFEDSKGHLSRHTASIAMKHIEDAERLRMAIPACPRYAMPGGTFGDIFISPTLQDRALHTQ